MRDLCSEKIMSRNSTRTMTVFRRMKSSIQFSKTMFRTFIENFIEIIFLKQSILIKLGFIMFGSKTSFEMVKIRHFGFFRVVQLIVQYLMLL